MELVKNIFFNTDKIVQDSTVKISYVGTLFQNGSTDVYLHYGYGTNWDGVSEIKMEKTELGFQCEVGIGQTDLLNLCFRNSSNVWDNNEGQNYVFDVEAPVTEQEVSLVVTTSGEMQVHKGLRKSYIWSKKIRLAVYKIIKYVPKFISGNYTRKVTEN